MAQQPPIHLAVNFAPNPQFAELTNREDRAHAATFLQLIRQACGHGFNSPVHNYDVIGAIFGRAFNMACANHCGIINRLCCEICFCLLGKVGIFFDRDHSLGHMGQHRTGITKACGDIENQITRPNIERVQHFRKTAGFKDHATRPKDQVFTNIGHILHIGGHIGLARNGKHSINHLEFRDI